MSEFSQVAVHGRHLRWAAACCHEAGVPVLDVQPAALLGPQIYVLIVPSGATPMLAGAPWVFGGEERPRVQRRGRRLRLPGGWLTGAIVLGLGLLVLAALWLQQDATAAGQVRSAVLSPIQVFVSALVRGLLAGAVLAVVGLAGWVALKLRVWRVLR